MPASCSAPGSANRVGQFYAALPDPSPTGTLPLDAPIVCSSDPLRPAPPGLHAHHVAAHAARHLAHLAGTDPGVARCAEQRPELWARLREAASVPVAEHARAHALARSGAHRRTVEAP